MSCKILLRVGGGWGPDGLIDYKANLRPAKLKLADIGLELSLAKQKFFSHISRLHNGFIFAPNLRGPQRGPGPRAPTLLRMALMTC